MNISDMMAISDSYTDEVVSAGNALKYANEAIARINTKYSIELPFFVDATTAYTALSDSWLRRLVVMYINYSVKLNDSSLNEAMMYKNDFAEALMDFGSVYLNILDETYLDANVMGVETMDTTDAIDYGWFANNGRGGL